jgi:molybdopterin converting factor small subunit
VTVTVVCFGAMRDYLPADARGNRADLELDGGATVGTLMDALGAPRRLAYAVLVDGLRAGLDTEVHPGVEVTLMPPFTGGARQGGPSSKVRVSMPTRALPVKASTSRSLSARAASSGVDLVAGERGSNSTQQSW